ncbi:MAG: protein-L-isoaspartate O-methyltransferase [Candidatus Hydrogenedentes bacterium]|nr:protein-L-isoaspartate O-methyltransferase [Candidatus Hydrogenedentota bacterium]
MKLCRAVLILAVFAVTPALAQETASAPESPVSAGAQVEQVAAPESAAAAPSSDWTYERYNQLVEKTGRSMKLSEADFNALQARKESALVAIGKYLKDRLGSADLNVMAAFAAVPREYYHYNYEGKFSTVKSAYEKEPKPWGIGYGSALSDYLGQAYMTQLCKPKQGEVALEIGTGSGFQSSVLSHIVKEVYTIEIIEPLGNSVSKIIQDIGYDNVHVKVGDGYYGWPEVQGGFDIILVTCAALHVPPPLLEQLKPGGRLIIPVGPAMRGKQVLYVYTKDAEGKVRSRRDMGIYFIPMTGAMLENKKTEAKKAAPAPKTEAPAEAPVEKAAPAQPEAGEKPEVTQPDAPQAVEAASS